MCWEVRIFSVPSVSIIRKEVFYQSPIYTTPLLDRMRIDGEDLERILDQEYKAARNTSWSGGNRSGNRYRRIRAKRKSRGVFGRSDSKKLVVPEFFGNSCRSDDPGDSYRVGSHTTSISESTISYAKKLLLMKNVPALRLF